MGLWGTTHVDEHQQTTDGRTMRLMVEDHGYAGHGSTGHVLYSVDLDTSYGWTNYARAWHYPNGGRAFDRETAEREGRAALAVQLAAWNERSAASA